MAEIDGSALWSLRDVIRDAVSSAISAAPKDSGRTSAQFVRRDQDGTAWYRLLGSDVDTPCVGGEAAEFSEGDWAEVEVRDGSIYAIGNTSDPAARSSVVRAVSSRVNTVIRQSEIISNIANAAKDVAEATNQHFFSDDNGVHVTQVTQEVWEQAHEGPNMLLNSIGQLFRDGLANLISITTQAGARAITFWDGLGNDAENVTASFGGDGATIGRADKSHMALDYHSLRMIDMEGNTYLHISDLRDESGVTEITDEFIGDETKTSFALTYRATSRDYDVTVSDGSGGTVTKLTTGVMFSEPPAEDAVITVVYLTESPEIKAYTLGKRGTGSIGPMSFVIGNGCVASGRNAYAEGGGSTASGVGSHAECGGTASGTGSHAEGNSEASGVGSHAEGGYSTASGNGSHAEGSSIASGALSHAEGMNAQADGDYSHAQNLWTIAGSDYQTAIGKYNDNDPDNAFEIGNGTADDARSNALTVDWSGNTQSAGTISAASALFAHDGRERFGGTDALVRIYHRDANDAEDFRFDFYVDSNGNPAIRSSFDAGSSWLYPYPNQLASRSANTVWAAPNGSNGAPSFRKLVAADLPTVTKAKGGTGVTATQESTVTGNTTNVTVLSQYNHCWHNGIVCTVTFGFNLKANLASGATLNVGTVPEGWRAPYTVHCAVYGSTAAVGGMQAYLSYTGTITIRNNSSAAVGTAPNIYVMATFAM